MILLPDALLFRIPFSLHAFLLSFQRPGPSREFFLSRALPLSLMNAEYFSNLRQNLEISRKSIFNCEQSVIYIPGRQV